MSTLANIDPELIQCPFVDFGCRFQAGKDVLRKHIKETPNMHLALLCDGVRHLKRSMLRFQLEVEAKDWKLDHLDYLGNDLSVKFSSQYLWKIDEFARRFYEAKSKKVPVIFSPPFWTSRQGYKLAASVCLYGDNSVRGVFLSLFITILQGEYDSLQLWPFSARVTFNILDQNQEATEMKENVTNSVKPNVCKENRPFIGRPTGERNPSFGLQKFCPLGLVKSSNYVKDDVMFILIDVDLEDLTTV